MSADRNLLFGILALQLDFVTQSQLIAGMHEWVADKSRSLSEILEHSGALDQGKRRSLDVVVEQHIQQHDDDPQKSLSALEPSGEICRALLSLDDSDLQASISGASLTSGTNDTLSFRFDPKGRQHPRFKVIRLHEEGGLGRVFEAEDKELGRTVALKEIKEKYATDANSQARFVMEAEVTGGLEHPGVAPVYGLGRYEDGRPFYAMRFIRGTSLRTAIKEFHRKRWTDRGAKALAMRRLLQRFISVCETVQYAHDRGVIHRDLKPGNIVLGEHGETIVVDWGLAKARGRADTPAPPRDSAEPLLQPLSGSSIQPTILGTAVGSPGYMSPEQASGRHDELTTATDIYSLGGTLYAILTGDPPTKDDSRTRMIEKAKTGDVVPPRLIDATVPRPLEAICLKAMSPAATKRYENANELAIEMERFLADEPVAACPEGPVDRLSRLSRRHKTGFVITTIASLLMTGLALTGIYGINRQKELARAERDRANDNAIRADQARAESEKARAESELLHAQTLFKQFDADRSVGNWRAASKSLGQLPQSQISWDSRYLASDMLLKASVFDVVAPMTTSGEWDLLDASLSPNAELLAVCDASGRLMVMNALTGEELTVLQEGYPTPSDEPTLHKFWNVLYGAGMERDRLRKRQAEHPELPDKDLPEIKFADVLSTLLVEHPTPLALVWASDDRLMAGCLDGRLLSWTVNRDSATETVIARLNQPITSLAINPDGSRLVAGSLSGSIFEFAWNDGRFEQVAADKEDKGPSQSKAVIYEVTLRNRPVLSRPEVVEIFWCDSTDSWLIVRADGLIQERAVGLELLGSWQTGEPVRSAAMCEQASNNTRLALGHYGGKIQVFETTPQQSEWPVKAVVELTSSEGIAIEQLCFDEAAEQIFVMDEDHRLWQRRMDDSSHRVEIGLLPINRTKHALLTPGSERFPLAFHRLSNQMNGTQEGFFVAHEQIGVQFWRRSESKSSTVSLRTSAGPNARAIFDKDNPRLLWSIDQDGLISVVETIGDELLDRAEAHPAAKHRNAITHHPTIGVVTAGADGRIRWWKFNGSSIVEMAQSFSQHRHPWLDLDFSPDGTHMAAMDAVGVLTILDVESGEVLFSDGEEGPRPATGKLRYSADGARLAAYSYGQKLQVYERFSEQYRESEPFATIAGKGGLALAWSPTQLNFLVTADDYRMGWSGWYIADERTEVSRIPFNDNSARIIPTPDGRRFLALNQSGKIYSLEGTTLGVMTTIRDRSRFRHEMALSGLGTLATLSIDGAIQLLSHSEPRRLELTSVPAELVEICDCGPNRLISAIRVVQGPADDLWVAVHDRPQTAPEGRIRLFHWTRQGATLEKVDTLEPGEEQRIFAFSFGVFRSPEDEIILVVRRVVDDTYQGEVRLHRRTVDGWRAETIVPAASSSQHGQANAGHYPQLAFAREGKWRLLHHDMAGSHLRIAQRTGDGTWDLGGYKRVFGNRGAGMRSIRTDDGTLYVVSGRPPRVAPRELGRLDDDQYVPIPMDVRLEISSIHKASSGQLAAVLADKRVGAAKYHLAELVDGEWHRKYEIEPRFVGRHALDHLDRVWSGRFSDLDEQLILACTDPSGTAQYAITSDLEPQQPGIQILPCGGDLPLVLVWSTDQVRLLIPQQAPSH